MVPFEWMINLNAGVMCSLRFSWAISQEGQSLIAMIIGIWSPPGIYGLGLSPNGWWILGMIAIFSFGEMMASPTKMHYFASIAPREKGPLLGICQCYLGYWRAIGSIIAGRMYEEAAISRIARYLVEELGQDATTVAEMAKTTVVPRLAELTNQSHDGVRNLLWDTYDPASFGHTLQ